MLNLLLGQSPFFEISCVQFSVFNSVYLTLFNIFQLLIPQETQLLLLTPRILVHNICSRHHNINSFSLCLKRTGIFLDLRDLTKEVILMRFWLKIRGPFFIILYIFPPNMSIFRQSVPDLMLKIA